MNPASLTELLTWRDIVDVLLVAVIIYYLLLLIRGTRAVQMLLGIFVIGGVYYFAGLFRLPTLQGILSTFLLVLPFAIIVLFQQEIRRALAAFGRNPWWGRRAQQQIASTINDVVLASTTLASRRTGGLIVFQRLEGLRNYVENGVQLDATVTYDLLINLFHPDTPLHDGAVIIQQDRIAAAACFLPLTSNPELSKDLGTRHRAALGISEEADALALVVSEESGIISVAVDGEIYRDLDSKNLRNTLYKHLIAEQNAPLRRPA